MSYIYGLDHLLYQDFISHRVLMGDPGTVLSLVVLVDLGLLPSLDQLPIRLIRDRLKGMAVE
jgi:hypothetical protein